MITINPVQFYNNSRKYISFQQGNMNNLTPSVAILPLQNANAKINFEKEFERSTKADAVQSSMIPALGYKFVKTYNILFSPNSNAENRPGKQVNYTA